jgi:putative ABC transport system permease protein
MKRVSPQADLFFQRLIELARSLPGVVSAAVGSMERSSPNTFQIAGRPPAPPDSRPRVALNEVSGDFFRTLGVKLVKGRLLTDRDAAGAPWAVVVSEAFAKRFFPKEDPLGQILYFSIYSWGAGKDVEEGRPREIVGVVKDIKCYGPRSQAVPVVYGSYWQHPTDYPGGSYSMHLWTKLVLRTSGSPGALTRAVEQIVKDIDKEQVAFNIMPMERRLAEFMAPQRFWLELFGVFGGLAVVL